MALAGVMNTWKHLYASITAKSEVLAVQSYHATYDDESTVIGACIEQGACACLLTVLQHFNSIFE